MRPSAVDSGLVLEPLAPRVITFGIAPREITDAVICFGSSNAGLIIGGVGLAVDGPNDGGNIGVATAETVAVFAGDVLVKAGNGTPEQVAPTPMCVAKAGDVAAAGTV